MDPGKVEQYNEEVDRITEKYDWFDHVVNGKGSSILLRNYPGITVDELKKKIGEAEIITKDFEGLKTRLAEDAKSGREVQENKRKVDLKVDEFRKYLEDVYQDVATFIDDEHANLDENLRTEAQELLGEIEKSKSQVAEIVTLDEAERLGEVYNIFLNDFKYIQEALSKQKGTPQPMAEWSVAQKEISGEGDDAKRANDFLSDVDEAIALLKKALISIYRKMSNRAAAGFRKEEAKTQFEKIEKLEKEIKEREKDVDRARVDLENKKLSNPRYTSTEERALNEATRILAEKKNELEKAKSKTSTYLRINADDFTQDFDQTLAAVRIYQETLRNAVKETDVNEIEDSGMKERIRNILSQKFKNVLSERHEGTELHRSFQVYMDGRVQDGKRLPDSQRAILKVIQMMAIDNITEIEISLNVVHREIIRSIEIETGDWTKNKNAMVILYVFKSLRVAVSWLAFYLADKLFTEYYTKNKNAAANPKTVDLRWFVAIYASFQLVFDIIALVVMYFVRRIDPDVVSGSLMLDHVFDTTIVTLMVLASSFWVADIIQDKKYFAYRTAGKRAVRSLRTIMVWLLILHSLVPYFYIAGPNFTGKSKFKKLDDKVRKANKEKKAKEAKPA